MLSDKDWRSFYETPCSRREEYEHDCLLGYRDRRPDDGSSNQLWNIDHTTCRDFPEDSHFRSSFCASFFSVPSRWFDRGSYAARTRWRHTRHCRWTLGCWCCSCSWDERRTSWWLPGVSHRPAPTLAVPWFCLRHVCTWNANVVWANCLRCSLLCFA